MSVLSRSSRFIKAGTRVFIPPQLSALHLLIYASVWVSGGLILAMAFVLLFNGLPAMWSENVGLLRTTWHPAGGSFGMLPMLFGTCMVATIAIVIAAPMGVFSAIAISEFMPGRFRLVIKGLLELLAGIPSIIYGLIGIAVLSPWLADLFDLQSGRMILTAGLLLAVMILPTIITLSEDALYNIPNSYREAGAGLGLFQYQIIKDILLPIAKADIVGAVLLAMGRALGETMAVMLVIGSIDRIPAPWTNVLSPAQTITSKLGREISESAFGSTHFQVLILMALILGVMGLLLTLTAHAFIQKGGRLAD